MQRPAAFPELC